MKEAGLPTDPELRRTLRQYMEWATAEVDDYSAPGSEVAEDLAVPHWGWNSLE
ncbi:MAG TPA: hypothetical protein VI138_01495 [Candidatus Dormibacteraeota bacterium]